MMQEVPEAVGKLLHKIAASWDIDQADMDAMIDDDPDRMRSIIAIASGTWSLYRDETVVRGWLREPAVRLYDEMPLDLMQTEQGLAEVQQYVEHLSGR